MDISKYLNFYINIPIIKGNKDFYERQFSDSLILPLTKQEYEDIYIKQDTIPKIEAPMEAGTYVGKIQVVLGDEILYEKSFYLEEDIYKKTVKDYILEGIHNLFRPTQKI